MLISSFMAFVPTGTDLDNIDEKTSKMKEGWDSASTSLQTIAKFFGDITWMVNNPYETFKIILMGLSNVAMVIAFVVSAASLFLMISGHNGGAKYMKVAIVVWLILKIVVVSL